MTLHLYNTRTGKKEPFTPQQPDRVSMYVCGPTVYDLVHIGNGRPAVVFDVLYRLLRAMYPQVSYVRNVTDIDDKINARAQQNGEPIQALADRFTVEYNADIEALGVLPPNVEPRATQHIHEIIEMIGRLIDKGHAYAADGHVLFHVPSDADYGKLARRSLEDMLDGARIDVAPYKQDPKDFVLWKPSTDDLPGWDSPWGRGRPGWHIECSAMINKHLGETIDIHGGGLDLTFPHHENEDAQSRCANDAHEYVRYWVHNGMLTLGDEKMSKSVGNVLTIRELRRRFPGEVLRYALLSGQYRSQLAWSDDIIEQARRSLTTLYQALRDAPDVNDTASHYRAYRISDFPDDVVSPLLDDLNTPRALAAMHALAHTVQTANDPDKANEAARQLLAGGWLLGILDTPVQTFFQGESSTDAVSADAIETLVKQRDDARAARDFAAADRIRDELLDLGVELEDTRDGTRWRRSSGA